MKMSKESKKSIRKKLLIILLSVLLFIVVILGVFFLTPFLEHVKAKSADDSVDWMKNIDDDILISDISIPGTHDSGTAHVQYAFIFRCQDLTIAQQLDAGFRYLDIRLRMDGNDLVFCHNFAFAKQSAGLSSQTLSLGDVLKDIYSFLDAHPSETVIFVVKSEYKNEDIELFQATLDSYIKKNEGKWLVTDQIPTLGECRGKIVLYRRFGGMSSDYLTIGTYIDWVDQEDWVEPTTSFSIESKGSFDILIQDRYKFSKADKIIAIEKCLEKAYELKGKNTISINFISTIGKFGISHPAAVAKDLNDYMKDLKLKDYAGWVIFDFGDADLASMIYKLNY